MTRILLIEDNDGSAPFLAEGLALAGHTVAKGRPKPFPTAMLIAAIAELRPGDA